MGSALATAALLCYLKLSVHTSMPDNQPSAEAKIRQQSMALVHAIYSQMVLSAYASRPPTIADLLTDAIRKSPEIFTSKQVFISESLDGWRRPGGVNQNDVAVWMQFNESDRLKYVYSTFGNDVYVTNDLEDLVRKGAFISATDAADRYGK
jgi:hypothetical protein